MPKSKRKPPQKRPQAAQMNAATTTATSQPAATAAPRAASSATRASVLTGTARHPYIAGELKRIGILTGIVLVVLIILAFALPRFI